MKCLVLVKPRAGTTPTSAALVANREIVNSYLKSGVNDCVYVFPDGGAFAITNADSADKLLELLMDLPAYPFFEWDVRPLADFNKATERIIAMLKRQGM